MTREAIETAAALVGHRVGERSERNIAEGLTRTNGNKTRLAKELGISRANLIMKVQKYNLERARRA